MQTVEYTLKEPVQFGSETVMKLTIRKPKTRDLKVMRGKNATVDTLALAAILCDQPPSLIDELSLEDGMELMKIVGSFMPAGPQTGESSLD